MVLIQIEVFKDLKDVILFKDFYFKIKKFIFQILT